ILVLTTLSITPCSHFREPSDNFGNSIGRTSTFPGPTYTTPRLLAINVRSFKNLDCFGSSFRYGGSRGHYYPDRVAPFQLFAPLFLVRLHGGPRPPTFAFAPVGAATCQREVNDRQQHHYESIDKERAISQHENVTENYRSHPHNNQSRSQSGCFRDQEQNGYQRLERP